MARATTTHQTTVKVEMVAMMVARMTTIAGTTTVMTSRMITAGTTATIAVITTVAGLI